MEISIRLQRKGGIPSGRRVEARLDEAVDISAHLLANRAKFLIESGPKSGAIYRLKGHEHQASAPGEAPASVTGQLVNSIGVEKAGILKRIVRAAANYAAFLEFGTVRMAPRPFMRPAADYVRPIFVKKCEEAIRRGLEEDRPK